MAYPELFGRRPPDSIEVIAQPGCLRHDECSPEHFCRWTWCDSGEGWWFVCGHCKPCEECGRNGDGIDLACGYHCPEQPSEELRFLQGEYYSSWEIPGTQLACLYTIQFLGDTLYENRMLVPRKHPASAPDAGGYKQEGACGDCWPYVASGVFRIAKRTPPMLLKVTYTSQSPQQSAASPCSNASSAPSLRPSTMLEAHEMTIDLIAAQRLSLVTWPHHTAITLRPASSSRQQWHQGRVQGFHAASGAADWALLSAWRTVAPVAVGSQVCNVLLELTRPLPGDQDYWNAASDMQIHKATWHRLDCSSLVEYVSSVASSAAAAAAATAATGSVVAGQRVSRPRGTGSVGDSVGEGRATASSRRLVSLPSLPETGNEDWDEFVVLEPPSETGGGGWRKIDGGNVSHGNTDARLYPLEIVPVNMMGVSICS